MGAKSKGTYSKAFVFWTVGVFSFAGAFVSGEVVVEGFDSVLGVVSVPDDEFSCLGESGFVESGLLDSGGLSGAGVGSEGASVEVEFVFPVPALGRIPIPSCSDGGVPVEVGSSVSSGVDGSTLGGVSASPESELVFSSVESSLDEDEMVELVLSSILLSDSCFRPTK